MILCQSTISPGASGEVTLTHSRGSNTRLHAVCGTIISNGRLSKWLRFRKRLRVHRFAVPMQASLG
jgi:hypothetical protein